MKFQSLKQTPENEPPEKGLHLVPDLKLRLDDFDFPTLQRYDKNSAWYKIAKKFLQCIFLTFPNSVLYASSGVMIGAQGDLLKRISDFVKKAEEEKKEVEKEKLERIIHLIDRIKFWRAFDHHDHWHVNYNPHLLDDEVGDKGEIIKSAEPGLANTIKIALQVLDEDNLWKELLKEEKPGSDKD